MIVFISDKDTAKLYVQFLTGQKPLVQCAVRFEHLSVDL